MFSFLRRREACESSVRVEPSTRKPQTPRSSSSRVKTRVGSAARARSSAELLLGQVDRVAVEPDLAADGVDLEVADPQPSTAGATLAAAQQGADAGPQFGVVEGLGDVIVGAAVEASEPIEVSGAAGEDKDRQLWVDAPGDAVGFADAANEVEAVEIGQAEIDERQVRKASLHQALGFGSGLGLQELVAVYGEIVGEELAGWAMVLDDQDEGGIRFHVVKRAAPPENHPPEGLNCLAAGPEWRRTGRLAATSHSSAAGWEDS